MQAKNEGRPVCCLCLSQGIINSQVIKQAIKPENTGGIALLPEQCQSALEWDPSCCRISECYPHSAIVLVDATSKYRPRQVAFPACSARGAVGGAGPT